MGIETPHVPHETRMRMLKRWTIIGVLLALAVASGCARKKQSLAQPADVEFRLTPMVTGEGEPEMDDMRFYVFNEATGVLAAEYGFNRSRSEESRPGVQLMEGRYTIVAWATDHDDIVQGGFRVAHQTAEGEYKPVEVNTTTMDQFRTVLDVTMHGRDGVNGDEGAHVEDFSHLFHAVARGVEVRPGESLPVVLNFVRNTHTFKIRLEGIQHLLETIGTRGTMQPMHTAGSPLCVYVTAKNGEYVYDNQIDPVCATLRYEPVHRFIGTGVDVDIKCLRLDMVRHKSDRMLLHVDDSETGEELMTPVDILEMLTNLKNENGQFLYPDQASLDRALSFPIEIRFEPNGGGGGNGNGGDGGDGTKGKLKITVTVGGFEYGDYGVDEPTLWKPSVRG